MYNKTIIEFGFCDIRNNQGLGKCNHPRPDVQKLLCEMQVDFLLKIQGQTHQAAASLETIQVLALFSQMSITHARYNLQL